jgi:hypothetical protein
VVEFLQRAEVHADEFKHFDGSTINGLCNQFANDLNTMLSVERWYTDNVSTEEDRSLVDLTIKSMESDVDKPDDKPVETCARRLLLRQRVNHIRNSARQEAEMAQKSVGQDVSQLPLVSQLSLLLIRKYCSPLAFGPGVKRDLHVFSGLEIALNVLIHTSEDDLPDEVNRYMRQAFPDGGHVKVLNEEALAQFASNHQRIWGLIRAVEYWRKPGFWD